MREGGWFVLCCVVVIYILLGLGFGIGFGLDGNGNRGMILMGIIIDRDGYDNIGYWISMTISDIYIDQK